jgi:hypothetical protein
MLCGPGHLEVTFKTPAAAATCTWKNGTILTLISHSVCGNMLRRVVGAPVVSGTVVRVTTHNATLTVCYLWYC